MNNKSAIKLKNTSNGNRNKLFPDDEPAHNWYRFVLSFPPQLVREYVERFSLDRKSRVLDPFCGTGTTLVECKKLGIQSLGFEAHPMPAFASSVKTNWNVNAKGLASYATKILRSAKRKLSRKHGEFLVLSEDARKLLLKNSISQKPLHKALVLLELIRGDRQSDYTRSSLLALAKSLIKDISNLHFGPEVGVRGYKEDAPVLESWFGNVMQMCEDLEYVAKGPSAISRVWRHDSRIRKRGIRNQTIDAVITSPPYPNEKDYTRTTRLESVILGLVNNKADLRALKQDLLRSNTRNVYKADDDDLRIASFPKIQAIANKIEEKRIELGKTSGFERQYARVTKLYFGGMARHLSDLKELLRPGARLAYVVGDQASYLRVMIRTGKILAEIAESMGYKVDGVDLFRKRLSTATGKQLREEVVVLTWPGKK